MKRHQHYYQLAAADNYEFGLLLGEIFGASLREAVQKERARINWGLFVDRGKEYEEITRAYFPQFMKELDGYARASGVDFLELWALSLEDEFSDGEHCTTIVTNHGGLIAHNEDWEHEGADSICVLKRTIGKLTALELFYWRTLGGNSLSINSHGWVQSINTLHHGDRRVGVPRNIIARWLSETADPQVDLKKFSQIKRSAGYSHTFIHESRGTFNLECTAKEQTLQKVDSPFVHTNHYLSSLKDFEQAPKSATTWDRYQIACNATKPRMGVTELRQLTEAAMNPTTIGRMIVDLKNRTANVWLKREAEKGWVCYNILV